MYSEFFFYSNFEFGISMFVICVNAYHGEIDINVAMLSYAVSAVRYYTAIFIVRENFINLEK